MRHYSVTQLNDGSESSYSTDELTDPLDIDVDHLGPLKNAPTSGA